MTDIHYFGNINYYITLLKVENIIFSSLLPFQKGWFNNKTIIASSVGPLKLSVPIVGGRNRHQAIKDVKIAYDQNWRQQHLRAIETCYRNAPFFDFYFFQFEKLFLQKFESLIELNISAHQLIAQILKFEKSFRLDEELINSSKILHSKNYCKKNECNDLLKLKYEQVFENKTGFQKNSSIIDLIFCCGPQSKQLLNNCVTI